MALRSTEFTSLGFTKVPERFNNSLKFGYSEECKFFAELSTSLRSVKTVSPDRQKYGVDNERFSLE